MALNAEEIVKRYNRIKQPLHNWRALWQEIADYFTPWRNVIVGTVAPGTKLTDKIYDSTAVVALTTAASAIHGSITPSTMRWFSFTLEEKELLQEEGVMEWLEDAANRVFRAISSSNFDSEAQEYYSDLLAFGTAAMAIEENEVKSDVNFSGVRFQTQQPGQFVISEGPDGIVDGIWREFHLSKHAAARKWGKENLSEAVQEDIDKGKGDEMLTVLHVVLPRDDVKVSNENDLGIMPLNRPFASAYIEIATGTEHTTAVVQSSHLIKEDGTFEFPIPAARWRKLSGEVYGRSPGMNVLPDVRTLNEAVKLRLRAWVLQVAPPIMTTDRGVIGNVRLEPFGRTYIRPGAKVEQFEIASKFDVANFQEEQLRAIIRQGLFVDLLQFQSKQGTPISATEAAIRFQTMQRIMGPVVSRLQDEFLIPVVRRVFRMMIRNGAIPAAPPAISELGTLGIIFEGPLARVQRATDVESINQFMSLLFPIAEAKPDVMERIDDDELVETIARSVSLPAPILRSREEAAERVAAKRQQEAQQTAMQNLVEAAKVFQSERGTAGGGPQAAL